MVENAQSFSVTDVDEAPELRSTKMNKQPGKIHSAQCACQYTVRVQVPSLFRCHDGILLGCCPGRETQTQ